MEEEDGERKGDGRRGGGETKADVKRGVGPGFSSRPLTKRSMTIRERMKGIELVARVPRRLEHARRR